jgi:hypothetical protein
MTYHTLVLTIVIIAVVLFVGIGLMIAAFGALGSRFCKNAFLALGNPDTPRHTRDLLPKRLKSRRGNTHFINRHTNERHGKYLRDNTRRLLKPTRV